MEVSPAPELVPSQRLLAPSVASETSIANDKGDNEIILEAVHRLIIIDRWNIILITLSFRATIRQAVAESITIERCSSLESCTLHIYVLFCTMICIIFTSLCKNLVKLT